MLDLYKRKKTAYRLTFGSEVSKDVLADLRVFCNATKTNFSSDALEMARMEGRREVFNRIMSFMKVDYEDYYQYEEDVDV